MDGMQLIKTESFGTVPCDFYNGEGDIWLTREQIGKALEYTDPMVAIGKMHDRHRDRLSKFSFTTLVNGRHTYFYNIKGLYEICRWSQQPKANAFMDWAWDTVEKLRRGEAAGPDIREIIMETAKAVVSEVVRQLVPVIINIARQQTRSTEQARPEPERPVWDGCGFCEQRCKLETFPDTLRSEVDAMLDEMVAEQNLNFSRIARYCVVKGYSISSPSVKTYFKRREVRA